MLLVVRIVVLILLLSGTLVFGSLPICIKPYLNSCHCSCVHHIGCATRKRRIATCCLIFFGGGVLLATCLVHLLHEARQGFEEAVAKCIDFGSTNLPGRIISISYEQHTIHENDKYEQTSSDTFMTTTMPSVNFLSNKNITRPFQSVLDKKQLYDNVLCRNNIATSAFPFPEFITVCGFFLLYFVEEAIKWLIRCYQSFRGMTLHLSDIEMAVSCSTKTVSPVGHIRQLTEFDKESTIVENLTLKSTESNKSSKDTDKVPNTQERSNGFPKESVKDFNKQETNDRFSKTLENALDEQLNNKFLCKQESKNSINDLHFFYNYGEMNEINVKGLEVFMTILALSFSSVFEGFALGFQHTEISTWMLFVSLALHKYVSAFVVSLEALHKGGSNLRVSLYLILFSVMCPLGMVAAILTHHNLFESGSLRIAVLNALSVGTLLYVTFYEMLQQRKDFAEISGFAQFFVLLLGFLAMSTVEYFYTRVE